MSFVQVADFRLDAECDKQAPAADPEQHFLLETQFRATAVKFARDPAIRGEVRGVVAVEQVEFYPANLDLPGAQPDRVTG